MKIYSHKSQEGDIEYIRLSELAKNVREMFLGWSQNQTSPIIKLDDIECGDAVHYDEFRRFIHETVPG